MTIAAEIVHTISASASRQTLRRKTLTSSRESTRLAQPTSWATRGLLAASIMLAAAGGIWWGWDADPARGKLLLTSGTALFLLSLPVVRGRLTIPRSLLVVIAVVIGLIACFEFWSAVTTILTQSAGRAA